MSSLKKEYYYKVRNRLVKKVKNFLNPPILGVGEMVLGEGVVIESGVEIYCGRLVVGDGVVIRSGTRIEMTDLVIGDYTKINSNCLLTGTDLCRIGHNCWIGDFSIIDSIGTTRIGDGVGVGAHSQLWTHMYFGDNLEGCRFASHRPLVVEDDVWFVGHCIVSPIKAKKRSMALVGSVLTKDMQPNHVYAGVPADDVTSKTGCQFKELTLEKKKKLMEEYLKEFLNTYKPKKNRIRIVEKIDKEQMEYSQFSLTERQYVKNLYPEEMQFMRFLNPTKAKFLPIPERDWIRTYLDSF